MRLSNVKTRNETGLEHVLHDMNVLTPFGKKHLKEFVPFMPGEETRLEEEFQKIEELLCLYGEKPQKIDLLLETFMDMKDVSFTIERSKNNALTVVELFEIKSLLLKMRRLSEILEGEELSQEFVLLGTAALLDELDPRNDRLDTFYLYDEFSEKLAMQRKKKRDLELKIRREQKQIKQMVESKYGISMSPKFDYVVSKSNKELVKIVHEIPELVVGDEDYMSVIFTLKNTEEIEGIIREMDALAVIIEDEELQIRERLSKRIYTFRESLLKNCEKIGKLDVTLAKAIYAKQHSCVKPIVVKDHAMEIQEGRHLIVEGILKSKGKSYCPVSIALKDGVTCITGANMGGKTVSLKLVGLVALLTQYGFFVPCREAKLGLSNYVHILIGDSQSMERGLSSFGGEMEELKEILDHSRERSLLLIDEIASGTNPIEGLALTKSLVEYLKIRPYISLITTHFDSVTVGQGIRNMQVMGLANADFRKLERELKYANRKERIDIIGKYMDYRLYSAESGEEIPKDALNIAKILGINDEIIGKAKEILDSSGWNYIETLKNEGERRKKDEK
ncbi:MutS-related protein [Sinanaerobacter chloroacetimidivorans]|uniref:DNA mismatch repair protein MutS n=1 Tax=Sinanaerobacter chloroacetimidivorans TaxID=2818044 RepID=A0A8J7W6Q0_9FIRM|nr:DNA mismatch repair protein MutS [Sinanaerobacter chloroacetimidivorans]MBR0600165.1 DNA mismatch repair protein MutS [Sinanaerobacter chloroacetimidivorans]